MPDLVRYDSDAVRPLAWGGYEVVPDLRRMAPLGQPGVPQQGGVLYLERNPELAPLQARGLGSDPGDYWYVARSTPQVRAALAEPIAAIAATPWWLDTPALPTWAGPDHALARARHQEYCERVWWRWTQRDQRRNVGTVIRETLETAPVCGFAWFELTAQPVVWQLAGDLEPRVYWVPDVPRWRAPWTVSEWITHGEELVGLLADYSGVSSRLGGDRWQRRLIPATNFVHVAVDSIEADYEGVSWLRSAYTHLDQLRDALSTWGLSVAVNGLGTVVVTTPRDMPQADIDKIEAHLKSYEAAHVPYLMVREGTVVDYKSPQSALPDLSGPVNTLERMAMMGLRSSHTLVALQKAGGSFAARESATAEDRAAMDYVAQHVVAPPLLQALGKFLRFNFPQDSVEDRLYVPLLGYGSLETRDMTRYTADVALAQEKGLLDHPEFGPVFRRSFGLPAMGDAHEPAEPAADAPGPTVWLRPREVAARLRVSPSTVVGWCRTGRMPGARQVVGRWQVPESTVIELEGGAPLTPRPTPEPDATPQDQPPADPSEGIPATPEN